MIELYNKVDIMNALRDMYGPVYIDESQWSNFVSEYGQDIEFNTHRKPLHAQIIKVIKADLKTKGYIWRQ